MDRKGLTSQLAIAILLIAIIGTFYFATMRVGHVWGDDFALYIQHAKNIVEHARYDRSNYIFDPDNPTIGPRTYPPGYPLLLSFVYWQFGMNLTAMKIENIIIFLVFLLVLFFLLKPELPLTQVAAIIAIIGFNPYLWDLKDIVASDISFLFFCYVTLWLIRRSQQLPPKELNWTEILGIASFLYFSYATRSVGLVFVPVLLLYDLIRYRRISRRSVAITIIFLIGWVLQGRILHSDADYFRQINLHPKLILLNTVSSVQDLERLYFWPTHLTQLNKEFRLLFFVGLSSLAVLGYIMRIRREVTIYELFPPLYVATLTVFPLGWEPRYMLPVLPLFFLYAFSGIAALPGIKAANFGKYVFIGLLLGTGAVYATAYSKMTFGEMPDGVGKKEVGELFEYVRANTDPTSVLIFRRPRALGLFAERRSSAYHPYRNENDLWQYFNKIHADYLVEGPIDEPYWHTFIASQKPKLRDVYSNSEFTVYKIEPTEAKNLISADN